MIEYCSFLRFYSTGLFFFNNTHDIIDLLWMIDVTMILRKFRVVDIIMFQESYNQTLFMYYFAESY